MQASTLIYNGYAERESRSVTNPVRENSWAQRIQHIVKTYYVTY